MPRVAHSHQSSAKGYNPQWKDPELDERDREATTDITLLEDPTIFDAGGIGVNHHAVTHVDPHVTGMQPLADRREEHEVTYLQGTYCRLPAITFQDPIDLTILFVGLARIVGVVPLVV